MPITTVLSSLLPAILWVAPMLNQPVSMPVPQARDLSGLLSLPDGTGPWSAVVIASGSNYPKEGAIMAAMTVQVVAAGWAVLTFDWSYTTYGGGASSGRKREKSELQAALNYLRGQPEVNSGGIVVAGKSLGSAVAYAVFLDNPDLLAAALLTPVFRTADGAQRGYPGLADQKRPIHLLTGSSDPLNARPVMEAHLTGAGQHSVTTVVAGDHGLNMTRKKDDESQAANRANVEVSVKTVVAWLGTLSTR